ncbi:MAG: hypothetical protein KJ601_07610 [Nanoarchaeota archaeon]|nr:hypothetical protein [Nanoarchaeota archaeon]
MAKKQNVATPALEQTVEVSAVQIRRDGCLDVDRQYYGGLITDEQSAVMEYQSFKGVEPIDGELSIDLVGLDFTELKSYLGDNYKPGQELPEAALEYLNAVFEQNQDRYKPADQQPIGAVEATGKYAGALSARIDNLMAEYRLEKAALDVQHKLREDHLARKTEHVINQQLRMAYEENAKQYRSDMKTLDEALGVQQGMFNQDGLVAFTFNKGGLTYELKPYKNPMQQAA